MANMVTGKAESGGKPQRLRWRWTLLGAGVVILAVIAVMAYRMSSTPAELNTATRLATANNLFQASYQPKISPIPINQMHTWTLHLETPGGQPVENATITVDGGMPEHMHGLPTRPEVTRYLGQGNYQVEGMKFQMTGWWVVNFTIAAGGQQDQVTFNLLLK